MSKLPTRSEAGKSRLRRWKIARKRLYLRGGRQLITTRRTALPSRRSFVRIKDTKEDLLSHILKLTPFSSPSPLLSCERASVSAKSSHRGRTSSELAGIRVFFPFSWRVPRGGNQFCIWTIKLSAFFFRNCAGRLRNIGLELYVEPSKADFHLSPRKKITNLTNSWIWWHLKIDVNIKLANVINVT